jgi:hypothetical protein
MWSQRCSITEIGQQLLTKLTNLRLRSHSSMRLIPELAFFGFFGFFLHIDAVFVNFSAVGPPLVLSCITHALAGRPFPAGERGSAAGPPLALSAPRLARLAVPLGHAMRA